MQKAERTGVIVVDESEFSKVASKAGRTGVIVVDESEFSKAASKAASRAVWKDAQSVV